MLCKPVFFSPSFLAPPPVLDVSNNCVRFQFCHFLVFACLLLEVWYGLFSFPFRLPPLPIKGESPPEMGGTCFCRLRCFSSPSSVGHPHFYPLFWGFLWGFNVPPSRNCTFFPFLVVIQTIFPLLSPTIVWPGRSRYLNPWVCTLFVSFLPPETLVSFPSDPPFFCFDSSPEQQAFCKTLAAPFPLDFSFSIILVSHPCCYSWLENAVLCWLLVWQFVLSLPTFFQFFSMHVLLPLPLSSPCHR